MLYRSPCTCLLRSLMLHSPSPCRLSSLVLFSSGPSLRALLTCQPSRTTGHVSSVSRHTGHCLKGTLATVSKAHWPMHGLLCLLLVLFKLLSTASWWFCRYFWAAVIQREGECLIQGSLLRSATLRGLLGVAYGANLPHTTVAWRQIYSDEAEVHLRSCKKVACITAVLCQCHLIVQCAGVEQPSASTSETGWWDMLCRLFAKQHMLHGRLMLLLLLCYMPLVARLPLCSGNRQQHLVI